MKTFLHMSSFVLVAVFLIWIWVLSLGFFSLYVLNTTGPSLPSGEGVSDALFMTGSTVRIQKAVR